MKKIILKTSSLGSYTFTGNTKEASFAPSADTDVSLYRIDDDYGKQVCLSAMGSNKIVKARLVLEGAGNKPANVPVAGKVNLSFISGNFSSADNVEKSLYEINLSFAQWNEWEDKNLPIDVDTNESDWNVLYTGTRPLLVSEIEANTEFNLIDIDVPSAIVGEELDVFVEMELLVDKVVNYDDVYFPLAEKTLRFQFSKKDYDPEDAGVGSTGTWTKLDKFEGVWDWTTTATNWTSAFQGAFPDADNEVRVIAVGDVSSVTTMSKLFAGDYSNSPAQTTYFLNSRNNIVSCVPFDAKTIDLEYIFVGTSLRKFVEFKEAKHMNSAFADTTIEEIGDVSIKTGNASGLLARSYLLKKVGVIDISATNVTAMFWFDSASKSNIESIEGIKGTSGNTSFQNIFAQCGKLKRIGGEIDCSSATNCAAMFSSCYELEEIPVLKNIGTANITTIQSMFSNCRKVSEIPLFDTSHSSICSSFIRRCYNIESIPDYDFSSATNANTMCSECFKVKSGITETYAKLLARGGSLTSHTDTFLDCGRDTPEGRYALSQIPASWGGTGS